MCHLGLSCMFVYCYSAWAVKLLYYPSLLLILPSLYSRLFFDYLFETGHSFPFCVGMASTWPVMYQFSLPTPVGA